MYGVHADVDVKAIEINKLLAALKVFLEHGIEQNFVVDHAPDALVEGWTSNRAADQG